MKNERNILIAFILNLSFSVFEFIGGIMTGSVAIASDAVHDIGDAASIGISYFFEKKSKTPPDGKYTFGYTRFSVLGGFITTVILLIGSAVMIYNSIGRIISPVEINYSGMIIFALIGVCVNFGAALLTGGEGSLNQKAVNLHMLEDVLGWITVLIGAVIMRFTNVSLLDPIMSVGISLFIIYNAIKNLKIVADLFLEKAPIDINEIKEHLEKIEDVVEVHHIHVWSLDGQNNLATVHVVTDGEPHEIKDAVRKELGKHKIGHATVEIESNNEHCQCKHCESFTSVHANHCHHRH